MNIKTHIKIFFIIFLPVIAFLFSIIANNASAAVSLPWSTTYNCADWIQGTVLNCDGLSVYGGWTTANGSKEQITAGANNPSGVGGSGQRHWIGDGVTVNSGGTSISFNTPQPELWIRWYMRHEQNFKWSTLTGEKWLYVNPGLTNGIYIYVVPGFSGFDSLYLAGPGISRWSQTGNGWNTIMASGQTDANGNKMSDGQWHVYEVHIKMDTNGSDGIGEIWIDGIKRLSSTNMNFNTQPGWDSFVIGSNRGIPNNGRDMYVDYDDMAVSTTGYIGPISSGATDTTPPSAPSGLAVN